MSSDVTKNDNPRPASHQVIVDVLFQLRRSYGITVSKKGSSFFHVQQETKNGLKVIGFSCDQLMAIDKVFDFLGIRPPMRIAGMIERRYWLLKEFREVVYG